ncbi:MAG: HAMP domain-containing histidine kinase [Clostridia bacterium]|nr:HAMP domain-containing histidine kinase [Clostridia bacterium]MBO4884913.1 HAMP domain-containing histidine kinase [Clostridia bacterium]MBR4442245.1 HAMP domain-containing histidine kinase [Clostridia bacterium]
MKNSLFWRMFLAFMAALIVTIMVLSFTMVALMRAERQAALEAEVRVQARDLAQLMQVRDVTAFWQFDPSAASSAAVNRKIDEIQETYDAAVWLVNSNGYAVILNGGQVSEETLRDERVIEQIKRVLSGEELRQQGLVGQQIVSIGVPWFNVTNTAVLGAVLLNVSVQSLAVDYSDLIRYSLLAGVLALTLGAALALFIARRQSQPIRQINEAVQAFAHGDFDRRVTIQGADEAAQLAQSFNSMAEELGRLDQSRRSFVANVSHELRSPMTCIQGYVQGMLDGTIREDEREKYLGTVLSETQRLTKLISELLDLSRFESGKLPLEKTRFDIDELILGILFKYERRIEDKGIDVEISFKEQPCYVLADSARITQVITNLVDNAVKFAAEKGRIVIWTHVVDALCYVTIKNDGAGIPAADLPFVFERFYKVDKAHTSGGGTGLGLAIAKRIVEQHGQSISVTSSGGMTSFVFTLERTDGA